MRKHAALFGTIIFALIGLYNSDGDLSAQQRGGRLKTSGLTTGYNEIFAGSGECANCHNSHVNSTGQSVAIANDWRSTMMANAAKDPLWRAKVSSELKLNPGFELIIENKCTSCHAPAGNFNANLVNGVDYRIQDLGADVFGLDGVQCTVCHQIPLSDIGSNSAHLNFNLSHSIWGPFDNPLATPMFNFTGYTPQHSSHVSSSQLCGACHTLLTQAILDDGTLSESYFVEQSVLQEWENSVYPDQGTTCQDCHMPRTAGPIQMSNRPPSLAARDSLSQHHFVGANLLMNTVFQQSGSSLGILADQQHLQNTEERTRELLEERSLEMDIQETWTDERNVSISVVLKNKAGHKLPSGFPSRRMWLELKVETADGDVIFHSGMEDEDGRIIGEDEDFEPHYDIISQDDQVQIYEIVMGDQHGQMTRELLRAVAPLKDNRLLPLGFKDNHISYDTVPIVGEALQDSDYQQMSASAGFVCDTVTYNLELSGAYDALTITAAAHYQTLSNKWMMDFENIDTPENKAITDLLDQVESKTVLIGSVTKTSNGIALLKQSSGFEIFPNPSSGKFWIKTMRNDEYTVSIQSLDGQCHVQKQSRNQLLQIDEPLTDIGKGIYIITLAYPDEIFSKKLLVI